jgi:hypothetical protein
LKAGILYPQSRTYPLAGTDFLEGLESALRFEKVPGFELMKTPIGFGTNEKAVYQSVEQLITEENIDFLAGWVDDRLSRLLQPLVQASDKPFIVASTGANHPSNWAPPRTTVFVSLFHSYLSALAGRKAFENGLRQGALAASFFDGGYRQSASAVNSFLRAGGTILYNFVSQQLEEQMDPLPLLDALASNHEPLALFSFYSGSESALYMDKIKDSSAQTHHYLSPLMLERQTRALQGSGLPTREGYISWNDERDSSAYEKYFKSSRKMNVFSLLGWETGQVMARMHTRENKNAGECVDSLGAEKIFTPRGECWFDTETNFLLAPFAYCRIARDEKREVHEHPYDIESWREFISMERQEQVSGWNNIYPCY